MQANIARARAGGKQNVLEVTKSLEVGGSGYIAVTVPELIGKQNVIAKVVKSTGASFIYTFVCVLGAGDTFAIGYESGSGGLMPMEKAEYDPGTGKFITYGRYDSDNWRGTYTFYAW